MNFLNSLPIHPFLVHFPIACWLLGAVILCLAVVFRKEKWSSHAWLLLALGALMSIPAAISGQIEYDRAGATDSVLPQWHRTCGTLLPWLMVGLVLLRAHLVWRRGTVNIPTWVWVAACILIAALTLYTGWLGGRLVYELGMGRPQP